MDKKVYLLEKRVCEINSEKTNFGIIGGSVSSVQEFTKIKNLKTDSIIAIPNSTKLIEQVQALGYCEFKDYVLKKYLWKKIVVFYGNCHMSIVSEIINKYEDFRKKYVIYPIKPVYLIKDKSYFDLPIFSLCDVFIHQSIRLNNRYGEDFASEKRIACLKKDCRIIAAPNVYQLPICFFPQYIKKTELRKKDILFFRDSIIDQYYKKGFSPKEIAKKYDNVEYDFKEIQKTFDQFIEKIKSREREWDIKVSDFILKNYKTQQLFYDPNHPTNYFLKYVAKELLTFLLESVDEKEIQKINTTALDTYQMPICSACKQALGLEWSKQVIRCTGIKVRRKKMDLKEYVLQYTSLEWTNEDLSEDLKKRSRILYLWLRCSNLIFSGVRVPRALVRRVVRMLKNTYEE